MIAISMEIAMAGLAMVTVAMGIACLSLSLLCVTKLIEMWRGQ